MTNFILYAVLVWFLVEAGIALWQRHYLQHGYRRYLRLLLPGIVLIAAGFALGMRHLPDHRIEIHGHRVDVPTDRQVVYLGSDPDDDVVFRYRARDAELIEPGLVEIQFETGDKRLRVTQTNWRSRNVVSVDGLPIRSLPLEVGKVHRMSFGAFGYSDADKDVLEFEIPAHRDLFGMVQFAQPQFRYRGQVFDRGFSTEIGWFLSALFPSIAPANHKPRHLAWNRRIFHTTLTDAEGSLLRQASLIRKGDRYWLVANNADIRLDGQPFPSHRTVSGSARLRIESHQLGAGRWARDYMLLPPAQTGAPLFLAYPHRDRRKLSLPDLAVADRLCLTRGTSIYSDAYDVLDDQFPPSGFLIAREGERFIFRGDVLQPGARYVAGKTVFSIAAETGRDYWLLLALALVFYLSGLFIPPNTLARMPVLTVLIATGMFLHALRFILAFRAWQGPPFNQGTFMDSLVAPYFFVLVVVVLMSRQSPLAEVSRMVMAVWNYFVPSRRRQAQPPRDRQGSLAVTLVAAYGLVLYTVFGSLLGVDFLLVIAFLLVISLAMGFVGRWESAVSMRSLARDLSDRYAPVLSLVFLLGLAMLAAPFLGGREIVPFLPGRLRPDIVIQVALLLIVAYQAGLWERERQARIVTLLSILLVFASVAVLPLLQGVVARDLGFFAVVFLPLVVMLTIAAWNLDARLKGLFALALLALLAAPFVFRQTTPALDQVWSQRVAYWVDRSRLRSEQFFDYLAHVPIQWSAAQGVTGGGYFEGDWYPALDSTAVNDNVAAVFINGELGGLGSGLIMAVYALTFLAALAFLHDYRHLGGGFQSWFIFGTGLMILWTAAAMFLQNLGYIPLTGKNLPLLGLDSKNDVLRYGLLWGLSLRYMRLLAG